MNSADPFDGRGEEAVRVAASMRAIAHPIRVSALLVFADVDMSPVELNRLFAHREWTLGVVAYHVRALAKAGLIQLAGTIQRRGAVEHRYSLTPEGRALVEAVRRVGPTLAGGRHDARGGRDATAS
jgi:DNA-binding PadR family transcriptional regulator